MSGLAAALLSLAYAGYVVIQVPGLVVPMLALVGALVGVLVFDAASRRAWCASFALIVAVLHARMVAAEAPSLAIQIGLASFVVASATLTLLTPSRPARVGEIVALVSALGLAVGAPAGLGAAVAGLFGAGLAGLRPMAALEAIRFGHSSDPWLVWSPLVGAAGGR